MALSENDKIEIKEVVREGLREFFEEQGLTVAQHTNDHRFVYDLQKGVSTVRKASLWTVTTMAVAALLGFIYGALTGKFG